MTFLPDLGSHSCLLFEGPNQQKAAVLPLVKAGLARGDKCVLVAPPEVLDDWLFEFQTYGIMVRSELEKQSLEVYKAWPNGSSKRSNSITRARHLWPLIEDAVTRFGAIRYIVDVNVNLPSGTPVDDLCHWEATLNPLIEGEPVQVTCMCNLREAEPRVIHAALRTHPEVVFRDRRVVNPYYEARRILELEPTLNASNADAAMVEDMLLRLDSLPY